MVEIQREASNVRPYVRSSMYKIKWTPGLHHSFLRAVNYLGGKSKATPKRILQHMNVPELTIAQVKSHLQLYRSGKTYTDGSSTSTSLSLSNRNSEQFKPEFKRISIQKWPNLCREAGEVYLALQLLKEGFTGGSNAELLLKTRHAAIHILDSNETSDPEKMQLKNTEPCEFADPQDKYMSSAWSPPCYESFLHETSTDNALNGTNSRSGRAARDEDVHLGLTISPPEAPMLRLGPP